MAVTTETVTARINDARSAVEALLSAMSLYHLSDGGPRIYPLLNQTLNHLWDVEAHFRMTLPKE